MRNRAGRFRRLPGEGPGGSLAAPRFAGRGLTAVPRTVTCDAYPMNASLPQALLRLAILVSAACAPAYAYAPITSAPVTLDGQPAADYPIPQERPTGDVRVASFGFVDLGAKGAPRDEAHSLHALHLRMVVSNNSRKPWTLDTRQQRVDLRGRGRSLPAFASADAGTPPPMIAIAAGGRRVVDLFFPLPPDEQSPAKLPEFDAVFAITTDAGAVSGVASFDRIVVRPAATRDDYGSDYWWGPPYWYDPAYQSIWFGDVSNLPPYQGIIPFVGPPVVVYIHGAPRWR